MKKLSIAALAGILTVCNAALSQASTPQNHLLHLVYQFGLNTKAASSGQGTGTTTIDVSGPASDGGLIVTGQDFAWNAPRPRAKNTCEVYPGGAVSCMNPYGISPMQLTIFPMLAKGYFKGVDGSHTSTSARDFTVKAVVAPGAAGSAGQLTTWNFAYALHGQGPVPNGAPLVLVTTSGTLEQQGGRSLKATSKQRIAYDPVNKVPAAVSDVLTHLPAKSVHNDDLVDLKLLKLRRGP